MLYRSYTQYQQMKNCDKCLNLEKRNKILQAEMTFQIRKLEEDNAHQKITQHLSHQKEVQKLTDKLMNEKHDRQAQNKKWIDQHDSTVRSYTLKLEEKERECDQRIKEMEMRLAQKEEQIRAEKDNRVRNQIEMMKGESEEYKRRLINLKEEEKKLIEKFHQEELQKNQDKYKKEKQFIEDEKTQLVQQIQELEKQNLMNKTIEIQLSEENFYQKEDINNLKEKIGELQQKVKVYNAELISKEKVLEYVRKEYNDRVKKLQKDFEKQKEELALKNQKNLEKMLEKELKNCQVYENKLQQIEEKRQAEIKIYETNFHQVKALVDENRCPPKFSNEISHLKYRLTSKQKQVQKAKAEVKLYQLQMENNDEILTKFFVNPSLASTMTELTHKRSSKEYRVKNNRGSMMMTTSSNLRSPSQNKERSPEAENHFSQFNTTSIEHIDLFNSAKGTKTSKVL